MGNLLASKTYFFEHGLMAWNCYHIHHINSHLHVGEYFASTECGKLQDYYSKAKDRHEESTRRVSKFTGRRKPTGPFWDQMAWLYDFMKKRL